MLAEQALREAIERIERVPGSLLREKAVLHNNLGSLLEEAGELSGAESHYRAALALLGQQPGAADHEHFNLLLNLGGLSERTGKIQAADESYRAAEAYAGTTEELATLNNNRATLAHRRGRSAEAIALLSSAQALLPAGDGHPLLRASILHNLGTVQMELGQLAAAAGPLATAERIRRERLGITHLETARTLVSLALLSARQGRPAEALATARVASRRFAENIDLRTNWKAGASRQSRLEWREAFATHLRLLAADAGAAAASPAEALEIMQIARHGELAHVFARALISDGGEVGEHLRNIDRLLAAHEHEERALTAHLQREGGDRRSEEDLRRSLAELRRQLEQQQQAFVARHPRHHELLSGQRLSLAAMQSILGQDEAILFYLTAEGESFVLAFSRDKARLAHVPVSLKALASTVRRIRRSVAPESADPDSFALAEAHQLYRQFLAPVADVIESRSTWFIVPDGPLESLPFSLLIKQAGIPGTALQRQAWVIRQHAPVTLPSLAALHHARTSGLPRRSEAPLLAVADPILGVPEPVKQPVRAAPLGDLWLRDVASGKARGDPARIRQLPPLPDTAEEARAIAATLGGGELLLGQSASETVLKKLSLAGYRNLLFATHGLMGSESVGGGEPALVMTPPETASEEDDGLLGASEIARLRLDADWVILSACNTAAGNLQTGAEGFSGLAKAFFHAGARNLLVSHWSVVSQTTVLLSSGTFNHLSRRPGIGKAAALQAAMLDLIDHPAGYAHPLFWAPFVLVGDAR